MDLEKIFQLDEEDTESDWTREETFLNQPQIWSAFSHAVATELCLETGANSLTPVQKLEEYSEAFKPLQVRYEIWQWNSLFFPINNSVDCKVLAL